jgi:hypothetical protein
VRYRLSYAVPSQDGMLVCKGKQQMVSPYASLQALRDEFPSSHCINCCVWPYESGEVLVQVSCPAKALGCSTCNALILRALSTLHDNAQVLVQVVGMYQGQICRE